MEKDMIEKWVKVFNLGLDVNNKREIAIGCEMLSRFLIEQGNKNINNIDTLVFPTLVSIISSVKPTTDRELGVEVFKIHTELVQFLATKQPLIKEDEAKVLKEFASAYINNIGKEFEQNQRILLASGFKMIDTFHRIGVSKEVSLEITTEVITNYDEYQKDQDKLDTLFVEKLTPEQLQAYLNENK